MKQPGLFVFFLCVLWQFSLNPAIAQEDPYHCDSLKVTCFNDSKIDIRFFNAPKTCPLTCNFCEAIKKEDWLKVQNQLQQHVKTVWVYEEKLPELRTWLLAHRLVNFVLPPEIEIGKKTNSALRIGFQVTHMTYSWKATFQLKKPRKADPAYWKFTHFGSDSEIYSRLNALGASFQTLLRSDSLPNPVPLLPDHNYLASWFGTRNLSPAEYAKLETQIRNDPREVVKMFTATKDGTGLALLMAHQNLAIRYLALQGIITIQDKNCLPYLLRLAAWTIQPREAGPEGEVLYANYCEQLVKAIGILSNCNFNRCPYAHYPPQHYLRLGLPTWESKINNLNGQGIGSYGTLL